MTEYSKHGDAEELAYTIRTLTALANAAWFPKRPAWMDERDEIERRLLAGERVRVPFLQEDWKMVIQSND